MKKHLLFLSLAAVFTAGASDGFIARGGKLTPVDQYMVVSSTKHLNFVHAEKIAENTIGISHSIGIHSIDEKTVPKISRDGGKTWTPGRAYYGFATIANKDGQSVTILRGRSSEFSKKLVISSSRHDVKTDKLLERNDSTLEFPFAFRGKVHRDIRRAPDGTLRSTIYGSAQGKRGFFVALIDSKDDGKNWNLVSIVDDGTEGDRLEGASEPCVETTKDGTVIVMMRSGSDNKPLYKRTSTDGGKTWSKLIKVTDGGSVNPSLLRLSDGTLVAITGRPGVYMLVDFSGTGENFDRIPVYSGPGSSYASVVELEPGKLMVLYDMSSFGSKRNEDTFNRIVASVYKIERGNFVAAEIKDGYQTMYKPECRKTPDALKLTQNVNYWHAPKGDRAYQAIVEIPERPHPVWRLSSRSKVVALQNRPYHRLLNIPSGVRKAKIGFEMRINDNDMDRPQLCMLVILNSADGKAYNSVLQFAPGYATISSGKRGATVKNTVKTGEFHRYEVLLDADKQSVELLLDNKSVFTGKMNLYIGNAAAGMSFGDLSNAVYGTVDISYLGWTFSL